MRTKLGSPEHFQQVIGAHVVMPWSTSCRCGVHLAPVGNTDAAWRKHIEQVWAPHALPAGFKED